MLEQTRGYLKIKGSIFGLDSCHFYENDYTKTMRFGVMTSSLNSNMLTFKYWFDGNSLEVIIKRNKFDKPYKYTKSDVHDKLKETFKDGDYVFAKAIVDISGYMGNIKIVNQVVAIYVDSNNSEEINDFDQTMVFDYLEHNILHCKLIDYNGKSIDYNNFIIDDSLLGEFECMNFGDLIRCSGKVVNEPLIQDGLCFGKNFYMIINKIISIKSLKYCEDDFKNQDSEDIITDESLMPWEM